MAIGTRLKERRYLWIYCSHCGEEKQVDDLHAPIRGKSPQENLKAEQSDFRESHKYCYKKSKKKADFDASAILGGAS